MIELVQSILRYARKQSTRSVKLARTITEMAGKDPIRSFEKGGSGVDGEESRLYSWKVVQ